MVCLGHLCPWSEAQQEGIWHLATGYFVFRVIGVPSNVQSFCGVLCCSLFLSILKVPFWAQVFVRIRRCSPKFPAVAGEVEVPLVQDQVSAALRKGGILELELIFFVHNHLRKYNMTIYTGKQNLPWCTKTLCAFLSTSEHSCSPIFAVCWILKDPWTQILDNIQIYMLGHIARSISRNSG